MVALLCKANASFEASRLDAPRADGAPNYTVDALAALRDSIQVSLGKDAALFCIVGADSFLDLRRWRDPERLLQLAEWIVVSRPGFSLDDLRPLALTHEQSSRVHLLTDVDEPVSSTVIREALHRGQQPAVLPASVAEYIRAHGLYRG
jgi:nicotinate-nucleotide adenylyltransferase